MTLSDTIRGSRRLLGDLRDVSLNSIIIALLSLLFHLVLSRKLGPVQYGELDTILTINMIILISVAAVSFIIARFVSYYKTRQQYDQMKYLVYWAFTLFLIAGVLSCTATIIFSKDIGLFLNMDYSIIAAAGFLVWISFLTPIIEGILRGLQQFRLIGLYKMLDMMLRVIIAIMLVYIGLGAKSIIIGLVVASIIALIFAAYFLKEKYVVKPHRPEMREIYWFITPVFLSCIFLALLMNVDLILVKHFFSPEMAGYYAAAGMLAKIIMGIAIASAGVMFPKIVEYHSNGLNQKATATLRNTLNITLAAGVLLTLILALFPHFISTTFFGAQYNIDYMLSIYSIAMLLLSITCILMFYNLAVQKYGFIYVMFFMAFITIYQIWHHHSTIYRVVWALFVINILLAAFMLINNRKELFST